MAKIVSDGKIRATFDKNARAIEWVGGTTYAIHHKGKFLKSCCIMELFEMYKASCNGLPIPERKHSLLSLRGVP